MTVTRAPKQKAPPLTRYPERCVWGTDWRHPRMTPTPEAGVLLDQPFRWLPDAATRQRILADNPAKLDGF